MQLCVIVPIVEVVYTAYSTVESTLHDLLHKGYGRETQREAKQVLYQHRDHTPSAIIYEQCQTVLLSPQSYEPSYTRVRYEFVC